MINGKITIRKIAEEAGVSVATVSRVFNDKERHKVGKAVRKRVQEIIEKYNFAPSVSAKGLVSGRTSLIGVQVLTVSDSLIHADLVSSIEETAAKHGYSIILGVSGWDKEKEERSIRIMLEKGVEGIIWIPIGKAPEKQLLEKIQSYNCPFIWLTKDFGYNIPFVGGDNIYGGYIAAEYCYNKKHKNIAFTGKMEDPHSLLRMEGYRKLLKEKNIVDEYIVESDYQVSKTSYEYIKQFIEKNQHINAFVCASDTMALGVYRILTERGIKIGVDVTVTGYGNRDYSEHLIPPLTTIAMRSSEIGTKAMDTLAMLISKKTVENVLVKPELVVRNS